MIVSLLTSSALGLQPLTYKFGAKHSVLCDIAELKGPSKLHLEHIPRL